MPLPRFQFTLRFLMILIAFAAIWFLIITEAIVYRARYVKNVSAWDRYR